MVEGCGQERVLRDARADLAGPLSGVSVLELATTWAGPMCGCILADFGAEVLKVEHPDGDVARRLPPFLPGTDPPLAFLHVTVNRNKQGLTLDVRKAEGREIFLRLAADADVVLQNFRPGTVEEWGVGFEQVRASNPDVIYVSISGYGQFGDRHDRVGYDPLAQAASGFLSLNGQPGGEPVKAPTFLADDLAGLHGALAAMAALRHRDQTGEGQHVDVALYDSLLFQSNGYLMLGAVGRAYPRLGNEFPFAAPARVFACKDGHVYLGALLDSQWQRVATLIGGEALDPDHGFGTIPGRLGGRAKINELVERFTAERTVAEVVGLCDPQDIPVAAVRSYQQAAEDPHTHSRDMLQDTKHTGGAVLPITGPAAKLSRTPTRVRHGAPALGEHNAEVLGRLGYTAEEIASLRERGVI